MAFNFKKTKKPAQQGAFDQTITPRATAPHCDFRVLHAPGDCEYCDQYPDWQEYRKIAQINFTNQFDPDKLICPSLWNRKGLPVREPDDEVWEQYNNLKQKIEETGSPWT